MPSRLSVSAFVLCIAVSLAATPTSVARHVAVTTVVSRTHIQPGETFQVAIVLDIDDGWHVYSPLEKNEVGIPLGIAPVVHEHVQFGQIQYPAGEKHNYKFLGDVWEYRDKTVIPVFCQLDSAFDGDKVHLQFLLSYQVCSESACQRPVKFQPLELSLAVKRDKDGEPASEDLFAAQTAGTTWMVVSQDAARPGDEIKVLARTSDEKSQAGKPRLGNGSEEAGSIEPSSTRSGLWLATVGTRTKSKYLTIEQRHTMADGSVKVVAVALPLKGSEATVNPIHSSAFGETP